MTTAETTTDMRDTWLVQRLTKPRRSKLLGVSNPFAFGGGYRNGGLSDDAMDLLSSVWAFDYMGAAEFEFGAVPKALSEVARQADDGVLLAWHFDILLSQVKPDFREPKGYKPTRGATARVYGLARADWTEEIERRVREMAAQGYAYRAKESTRIDSVLRPRPDLKPDDYQTDVCGWLELDNGFLFFTDREMWQSAAALFGVEVPSA